MDPAKAQQLAAELEVEMMADMYKSVTMTGACHRKCVAPHYKEAELHERLGRKLTELSVQDEEIGRRAAAGSASG
uniref:Tim10-like domain-containing protein n=1 Tax=Scleropages formosus TaxID=113540 RepID=A0A8C9RDQ5_SCLFO